MIKLSPYSNVFYNEWKINPARSDYHIVFDQEFVGKINFSRLKQAFEKMSADYLLLHSCIKEKDGEYYWVEQPNNHIKIDYFDAPLSELAAEQYVREPFDLERGYFLRCALIELGNGAVRLVVVIHHILMDGLKGDVFLTLLSHYYNDDAFKCSLSIEDQRQKLLYLNAELERSITEHRKRHQQFWKIKLQDVSGVDFSFLRPFSGRPYLPSTSVLNSIGEYRFNFGEKILRKTERIAKQLGITPYLFSFAILAILLYRFTGQKKIALSYPIAIRAGAEFIYGAHINTNIICCEFTRGMTVVDVLKYFKDYFFEAKVNNHDRYPIQEIMALNINPNILDVSFMQTNLKDKKIDFVGVSDTKINNELNIDIVAKLLFEQELKKDNIFFRVRYNKKDIDQALLLNFIGTYQRIFCEVLKDLSLSKDNVISKYSIVDESQREWILANLNGPKKGYPKNKTISLLFEAQVVKTPHNIALVYQNEKWTYKELNERANQLAHYLIKHYRILPDDLIVLCLERDEHILIAILAVLKAGGAYVPVDAHYPDERIIYILKDTKAKILLTNDIHKDRLTKLGDGQGVNILPIDDKSFQATVAKEENRANPVTQTLPSHLAYVIYTSGTTGRPKGVMIEHKSLVSFIVNFTAYPLNNKMRLNMLSTTNYVFDIFALEYMLPLLNGYKIELIDLTSLTNKVIFDDCDCIQITPSKLELLVELIKTNAVNQNTHTIVLLLGGEIVNHATLSRITELEQYLFEHNHPILFKVINVYGPTESTIWSTAGYLRCFNNAKVPYITIGKPLYNETVYVLDQYQQLLPFGAVGELYIGGDGVARGYLNQPKLTSEKFVSNFFQTKQEKIGNENNKLYRTGDLVRMLPSGDLEYLRRYDFQVKIRGYRIELGDIEDNLATFPGIKQAVVLPKEYLNTKGKATEDKYLIAYYVADTSLDLTEINDYLKNRLPEYMIPTLLVHLEKLPLTINGKLDRTALFDPMLSLKDKYVPPRNRQEQLICEAFANTLDLKSVGVNDDFFRLGGNSIKVITLVSKLQNNFKIRVADIFNLKTPKEIAKNIVFEKDVLKQRLESIKLHYQMEHSKDELSEEGRRKLALYEKSYSRLPLQFHRKLIKNVLLTGGTGYLGCNILNQLLMLTEHTIYLLLRGNSTEEAYDRVNKKFQFYFDKTLDQFYGKRLFVQLANLELSNLGLNKETYACLATKVDSIIHAAALTKHYGEYDTFYSANVQATRHLLDFCKLTNLKDFHYISSISIFNESSDSKGNIFTEDDVLCKLKEKPNVYIQTKYEGECLVIQYRDEGINSNVYRVGNLAFIAANYRVQENIEENAFISRLSCVLNVKITAKEIGVEEVSPVDLTAEAIVKMFDKQELNNGIYHVFNPHLFNLYQFFSEDEMLTIQVLPIADFIDRIIALLDKPSYQKLIERFLLHQCWLEDAYHLGHKAKSMQNRTSLILSSLEFTWREDQKEMFRNFINQAYLT